MGLPGIWGVGRIICPSQAGGGLDLCRTAGLWMGQGNAVALGSASPWDSSSLWFPKGAPCHASLSSRGRYQGPECEWVGSEAHKRPTSSPAI